MPSSGAASRDRDEAYADAILRELAARAPLLEGRRVGTVFFGGGTPSLWTPAALARVVGAIADGAATSDRLEITAECNPSSLDEERARALLDAGVNRLSIGVQSLQDDRLRFLGRLHDAAGAIAAVRGAMRAGAARVSADLIFGLPGQTPEDARAEAAQLADVGLTHLSAYQLTIEQGTRFGELARRGRLPMADEDAIADAFLAIDEVLAEHGLAHYEVSNYARAGEEARHNLGYWRGDEYIGLGCGAYGFVRLPPAAPGRPARGLRWRNPARPEAYIEATRSRVVPALLADAGGAHASGGSSAGRDADGAAVRGIADSVEDLDAAALLRERIMLGLRVREGIDLDFAGRDLGVAGWTPEREAAAGWLAARGRVLRVGRNGATIRIPTSAWLWTDDTAARLF